MTHRRASWISFLFVLAALFGTLHATTALTPQVPVVAVRTLAASVPVPRGVALLANGDAVLTSGDRIVVVHPDGSVSTVAGGEAGYADGPAATARFKDPAGVAIDRATSTIYVADSGNHCIRAIVGGTVNTVAGNGRIGFDNGRGSAATFKMPVGLAFDAGVLYVADAGNNAVRRVTVAGEVTTLAGTGREGHADGATASATFKWPEGVTAKDGIVYVADTKNSAIRRIANGQVSTVEGGLHEPSGIAFDDDGSLIIADTKDDVIRRFDLATGVSVVMAGSSTGGFLDGVALAARFNAPTAVAAAGAVFVVDSKNAALRVIDRQVTVSSIAPQRGPAAGGTIVTLTGSGFVAGATTVRFGSAEASEVAVSSSRELTCTAPAADGVVDVSVRTPGGEASLSAAYTYQRPPVIHGFTPLTARSGATLIISGEHFGDTPALNSVAIGGAPATVTAASSTSLAVIVPSSADDGAVTVTTDAGTATSSDVFILVRYLRLNVTPAEVSLAPGASAQLDATAAFSDGSSDNVTSLVEWDSSNDTVVAVDSGAIRALAAGAATISASYNGRTASVTVTVTSGETLPPDPTTIATPVDPTIATPFADSIRFLYEHATPVQRDVFAGAIEDRRAAVLRGRVLDRDLRPLPGVRVTAAHDARFGYTLSRADGWFDVVVNGGGDVTLNFAKDGFIPIHRTVRTYWNRYSVIDDAVMTSLDAAVTPVALGASMMQIARGSVVGDADGERRATLLFPAGTTATMLLPDGTSQPLTTMHVRATEYTVGPNGPKAMPAPLPPTSGYTYCVELSVDEALAAGAESVVFSQPVVTYVDNFLAMPIGEPVPVGYYDRRSARWIPEPNGIVLRVLSTEGGTAQLDVDGDGAPESEATLATVGVNSAERVQLASLYSPGAALWRFTVTHFSPYDANWGISPEEEAWGTAPYRRRIGRDRQPDDACYYNGSIVGCENQTLGERIAVQGTPFALSYDSARVPGRLSARTVAVSLTDNDLPPGLSGVELTIDVAGRRFTRDYPALPNLKETFTWDGRDPYGRTMQGVQDVAVYVGWTYPAIYRRPGATLGFADYSTGPALMASRRPFTAPEEQHVEMRPWDARGVGLGGWTFDVNHSLDVAGNLALYGDGTTRDGGPAAGSINTIAGRALTAGSTCTNAHIGTPGTLCSLRAPWGIDAGADGSVVFADNTAGLIYRIDPQGQIYWIAGGGSNPSAPGDGGTARLASIWNPTQVATAPDGTIYVSEPNWHRVRRIEPNGRIFRHAGSGEQGFSGDGGPATAATLNRPGHLAVGPDGSVYIADVYNRRIRRVTNDGRITTVVGSDDWTYGPDGVLATETGISGFISGMTVLADGTVLFVVNDSGFVFSVTPDGRLKRLMNLCVDEPCEGRHGGRTIKHAADGTLYAVNVLSNYFQLYRLSPEGAMTLVANGPAGASSQGNPTDQFFGGDGGPAIGAYYGAVQDFAVGPDHSIYISDTTNRRVRKVATTLARQRQNEFVLATRDGAEVHVFDAEGRHTRTVDPLLGSAVYTFGYDTRGRLETLTDIEGNVTRVERREDGATEIVAPGGQRTRLTFDGDGMLHSVSNEAAETFVMTYAPGGLLRTLRNPRGNSSSFSYDPLGRLRRDSDAGGGWQELSMNDRGTGYTVTRSTALGLTRKHETDWLENGDRQRVITDEGNLTTTILRQRSGYTFSEYPNGNETTDVETHDPRFGIQSPFLQASVVRFPSGKFFQIAEERTATLANAADPLVIAQETRSVVLGSRRYTSTFIAGTRTSTFRTPAGRTVTATLDERGRVSRIAAPGLAEVQYTYDALGRLRQVAQGPRTFTFGYNGRNELTSVTDPLSRVTEFNRDAAGRLIEQHLPGERVIAFGYDANGNIETVTPPGRSAHTVTSTPADLPGGYTPPEGEPTSFIYDAGRLKNVTTPDATIALGYGPDGRLATVTSEDNAYSLAWNGATGQLNSVNVTRGASLAYTFDGSLPTSATWSGPISGTVAVRYDGDLRVAGESVNGSEIAFGYDADRLLTAAGGMSLTRDPANGALKASSLGNVQDSWVYNTLGETETYTANYAGNELLRLAYVRDAAGRITKQTETVAGVTTVIDHTYDAAGRLETVKRNGVLRATYAYDMNGNRLSRTGTAGEETGSYDGQDRMLAYAGATYTYTAAGALMTRTDAAGTTTYGYDAFGNLRSVVTSDGTVVEYVVDAQNRRVGQKVNGTMIRRWLYGDPLRVVAELDGDGALISRFVYASRTNVPDFMIRGGQTYRILTDHLGSPRLIVNVADSAVVQQLAFDEFGRVLTDTNPGFQPFGYAGGLSDRNTGLVTFGARDYDPHTGRFTTKDPIGFAGGDTNLYVYVLNDPINLIDPMGTDWVEAMEPVGNFFAGMGDTLSFGLTTRFNEWTGASAIVDKCSAAFNAGEWTGTGVSVAFGASHLGRNAFKHGVRRLAYDNRTWGAVRSGWSGRPGTLRNTGRSLHHWLIPQRAVNSGAPRGIVNAGFNYMPISAGLNSYMNGSTATRVAVEWGFKGAVAGIYGGLGGGSGSDECGCQ